MKNILIDKLYNDSSDKIRIVIFTEKKTCFI